MIDPRDLSILRQYALMTGVTHIVSTVSGVCGVISHDGVTVDVALDIDPESGAVTMLCLSGPDAGEAIEVSTIGELRDGISSGAFEAARAATADLAARSIPTDVRAGTARIAVLEALADVRGALARLDALTVGIASAFDATAAKPAV